MESAAVALLAFPRQVGVPTPAPTTNGSSERSTSQGLSTQAAPLRDSGMPSMLNTDKDLAMMDFQLFRRCHTVQSGGAVLESLVSSRAFGFAELCASRLQPADASLARQKGTLADC